MFLPEDIDLRIEQDEWNYLIAKYPHVAFNIKPDRPGLDGFFPKWNSPDLGFRHLLQLEPYNALPEQWNLDLLRDYDSVIAWNSKFYQKYKNCINMHLIKGCTFFNNYHGLQNSVLYENKINGIVCINKLYTVPENRGGHIVHKRQEVVEGLSIEPMVKHVFSPSPWGGELYQGQTEVYCPGHWILLDLIAKYKFKLCFESLYHEFWSWDFVTERLFDCFKAKTVPIYWGCYNIEKLVPAGLFIDFRQFDDLQELSSYLINFPEDQYRHMTEAAFEWVQKSRIGNVQDLEILLQQLN